MILKQSKWMIYSIHSDQMSIKYLQSIRQDQEYSRINLETMDLLKEIHKKNRILGWKAMIIVIVLI
jgi:hypothetical protein